MRQPIEEEFILDVLINFMQYKLANNGKDYDDVGVEKVRGHDATGALGAGAPLQHQSEGRHHGQAFPPARPGAPGRGAAQETENVEVGSRLSWQPAAEIGTYVFFLGKRTTRPSVTAVCSRRFSASSSATRERSVRSSASRFGIST